MGVAIYEQETVVSFMRDGEKAKIYTSDSTVMTRLDKLAENEKCPEWKLIKEHYSQNGELVGKTYETSKRLVSFRSSIVSRELTEEQKAEAAERLRRMRQKNKDEGQEE